MAEIMLTEEYNSLGGVGGTCALCNASKRMTDRPERIITTNLVTDMLDAPPGVWPEKWMEFCETCINEMGHLVGMISENEAQDLVWRLNGLESEKADLSKSLEEANELILSYEKLLSRTPVVEEPKEVSPPPAATAAPKSRRLG